MRFQYNTFKARSIQLFRRLGTKKCDSQFNML